MLVDEILEMDKEIKDVRTRYEYLRSQRNSISKQIGGLMAKGQKEEAEAKKAEVVAMADEMAQLQTRLDKLSADIRERMLVIPNIIDDSVPIGKDDSENVELERFGEPVIPDLKCLIM